MYVIKLHILLNLKKLKKKKIISIAFCIQDS